MFEHRLVPDGVHISYAVIDNGRLNYSSGNPMYHADDTIPIHSEWTAEEAVEILKMPKAELDEIGGLYCDGVFFGESEQSLSEFISELISLALLGLTVEEMKSLQELK